MNTIQPSAVGDGRINYVQWGPAIAGALAAAAIAFVLHAFAAAIGISTSSTAPTWRDASVALQLLSGLYLILVAVLSLSVGGYIAGRMRRSIEGSADEIEFRDGTQGLLVWAIAIFLTVLVSWAAAQSVARLAAPSASQAGSVQSIAGENIIAFDLDRLFRADKRPQNVDLTYARSEASRILLTAAGHSGVLPEDRAYLIRLVGGNTGLAQPEAEKRVGTIMAQARDNIRKARRAGVILAFMAGAAALLGAAVAWFASCEGGKHRDGGSAPSLMWGRRGRPSASMP
jgi:hypothetical protein